MAICIQSSFGAPAKPVTAKEFEAVLDNPSVAETYRLCRASYDVNKKAYNEAKHQMEELMSRVAHLVGVAQTHY